MTPTFASPGTDSPQIHITLRAGGGRGAYEITDLRETGHQLRDVRDKRLVLRFLPNIAIDTQLRVVNSGGKARFVTEKEHLKKIGNPNAAGSNEVRINRQLAAAMLMPAPTSYTANPPVAALPS